jgi:beta-N-acetylhexosaminidase
VKALLVVMGVSGSGKSTIGSEIARELELPFFDADSLHPLANIELMAAGTPLSDSDRHPWLVEVGAKLSSSHQTGLVMACSALKRTYRDTISRDSPTAVFVHLSCPREVLQGRMEARTDHFMPPDLLDSQLAALEPLQDDEIGWTVEAGRPIGVVVADVVRWVRSSMSKSTRETGFRP